MTSACKIAFQDATLVKQGTTVLGPLTLTTDARRIGVIGRNGSGKSSFLRLLTGLDASAEGTVQVDGIDPAKDRKEALSRIGVIFQNPDHQIIFPTVLEEMAFGLRGQGLSQAEAETQAQVMLDLHGRGDWAMRNTHHLSQGQRHLLCLLAVQAMEPRLIALDEPFAGLDIPTRNLLTAELLSAKQQIVLVTHDPELLAEFDLILWLDAGQIQAQGRPEAILPAFDTAMAEATAAGWTTC